MCSSQDRYALLLKTDPQTFLCLSQTNEPWPFHPHNTLKIPSICACIDIEPEFLKRADTQTHVLAKFSRICAKFQLLNVEYAKQALYFGTI